MPIHQSFLLSSAVDTVWQTDPQTTQALLTKTYCIHKQKFILQTLRFNTMLKCSFIPAVGVQICSVFCYPSELIVFSGSAQNLILSVVSKQFLISIFFILIHRIYLHVIIFFFFYNGI